MIAVVVLALAILSGPQAGSCYVPPVPAPVVHPFVGPECPYCPGRRGIGYEPRPGTPVVAVAAGTVGFAGKVAGVLWVTVAHADGRRSSYGHLAAVLVREGQVVRAGQPLAVSGPTLHLGVREGEAYVDPVPLLGVWRHRPRLVPVDGGPGRVPPPPRLECPGRPP